MDRENQRQRVQSTDRERQTDVKDNRKDRERTEAERKR